MCTLHKLDLRTINTDHRVIYNTYLHVGVERLRALRSFKVDDQAWSGDHDQVRIRSVASQYYSD